MLVSNEFITMWPLLIALPAMGMYGVFDVSRRLVVRFPHLAPLVHWLNLVFVGELSPCQFKQLSHGHAFVRHYVGCAAVILALYPVYLLGVHSLKRK